MVCKVLRLTCGHINPVSKFKYSNIMAENSRFKYHSKIEDMKIKTENLLFLHLLPSWLDTGTLQWKTYSYYIGSPQNIMKLQKVQKVSRSIVCLIKCFSSSFQFFIHSEQVFNPSELPWVLSNQEDDIFNLYPTLSSD